MRSTTPDAPSARGARTVSVRVSVAEKAPSADTFFAPILFSMTGKEAESSLTGSII
jgi:hypothetical protein